MVYTLKVLVCHESMVVHADAGQSLGIHERPLGWHGSCVVQVLGSKGKERA